MPSLPQWRQQDNTLDGQHVDGQHVDGQHVDGQHVEDDNTLTDYTMTEYTPDTSSDDDYDVDDEDFLPIVILPSHTNAEDDVNASERAIRARRVVEIITACGCACVRALVFSRFCAQPLLSIVLAMDSALRLLAFEVWIADNSS